MRNNSALQKLYHMKRFILAIFLAVSMASAALADAFQLVRQATGAYASEAAVYFNDKLVGYTDPHGRIVISMPSGTYTFVVFSLGQKASVVLTLTGNPQLQVVNF